MIGQREDVPAARLERDLGYPTEILRGANDDRRLGIADKIFDFINPVRGIERQVDLAGAQGREIQQQRFRRFLDLHCDARILRQAKAE